MNKPKPSTKKHIYNRLEGKGSEPLVWPGIPLDTAMILLLVLLCFAGMYAGYVYGSMVGAEDMIIKGCETGRDGRVGEYTISCYKTPPKTCEETPGINPDLFINFNK